MLRGRKRESDIVIENQKTCANHDSFQEIIEFLDGKKINFYEAQRFGTQKRFSVSENNKAILLIDYTAVFQGNRTFTVLVNDVKVLQNNKCLEKCPNKIFCYLSKRFREQSL